MQIVAYDDDFFPRVSFEEQNQRRHRQHRRASSCCGFPISPHLPIEGLSRKSLSYDKLPQQRLKLSVRKLDGSSFDVEVANTATVAELKQDVEGVFSHVPNKGPGKISCEPIINYGINDGAQLHFVRHVAINYNLTRRRSKDRLFALEQPKISDGRLEREQNGKKHDSSDDQEHSPAHQHDNDGNDGNHEDIMRRCEMKLAQLFGRWFSYRRLGSSSSPGRRFESSSFSSRLADDFLGSFRSIVRLCSSNKLNSQSDPLEEV